MTYRETLKWLSENWNGEFGEKCNVEYDCDDDWHVLDTYVWLQEACQSIFRLTRAEVERRTGRKVIEWREVKQGDRILLPDSGNIVVNHTDLFPGPRWILGDKLEVPKAKGTCGDCVNFISGFPRSTCKILKEGTITEGTLQCYHFERTEATTPKTRRPLTVSDVMLCQNEMMALAIEVDGMKAENQECLFLQQLPVYRERHFQKKAERVRALTKAIAERAKEEEAKQ